MSVQNMVSATIGAENKQAILAEIESIKGKLDFLLSLRAGEVMGLFKANKEYMPFIEECHAVAMANPQLVSGVFDLAEFDRDYQLAKDLGAIADAINQLSEAINQTLLAARSDAMVAGLEVYGAIKLNQDRVPGLKVVAERMAGFFKRTPRNSASNKSK